jgi:hypothetical protein
LATEPGERSARGEPAVEPAATAELAPQLGGPEVADSAEGTEPEVAGAAEVAEQAELGEPERAGPELGDAVRAAARRRRLAEVFGDVLPEATSDDRSEGGPPAGADDRWYTENRPPHHGG